MASLKLLRQLSEMSARVFVCIQTGHQRLTTVLCTNLLNNFYIKNLNILFMSYNWGKMHSFLPLQNHNFLEQYPTTASRPLRSCTDDSPYSYWRWNNLRLVKNDQIHPVTCLMVHRPGRNSLTDHFQFHLIPFILSLSLRTWAQSGRLVCRIFNHLGKFRIIMAKR